MQLPNKFSKWATLGRLLFLCCLLLVMSISAIASSGGVFDLSWETLDGGGRASSGGRYALSGTAGQADAGEPLSGGEYTLNGGFWAGTNSGERSVYLPMIMR